MIHDDRVEVKREWVSVESASSKRAVLERSEVYWDPEYVP